MTDQKLEQLISAWLDGRLNESESQLLQQQLLESSDARKTFRDFSALDAAISRLAGGEHEIIETSLESSSIGFQQALAESTTPPTSFFSMWNLGILIAGLIGVGLLAYQAGQSFSTNGTQSIAVKPIETEAAGEATISGHATLRRGAGIQWSQDAGSFREGDVLPAGLLQIDAGVAEIDFFCGATVVVEGPAKLDLESDWSVRLLSGRLRANVPPAAQGFIVKAEDSEIIDLGTEFAIEVGEGIAKVQVVDGEVKLRGGIYDGDHLVTGQGRVLKGRDADVIVFDGLSTIGDVQRLHAAEQAERFVRWKTWSEKLRSDKRLIAYYLMSESKNDRDVPNFATTGNALDGKIVGPVSVVEGRFGKASSGLAFHRAGSRVRALIDGEFNAFTFACWARVDALEHEYNALFMSDGYEDGEPHWQIRRNGCLMLSVMVDATPPPGPNVDEFGNIHHVYSTKPIWDSSQKGQWVHIASTYDPANRQVRHFVNGREIANEKIKDEYYIRALRIGAAEVGNWGQPFRKSPDFAVRNLNGAIDEMAIFGSALSAREIQELYENGKPFEN